MKTAGCSHVLAGWGMMAVLLGAPLPMERASAADLIAGPLRGHTTFREANFWLETRGAQSAKVRLAPTTNTATGLEFEVVAPEPTPAGGQLFKLRCGPLEPGTEYGATFYLDDAPLAGLDPVRFRTPALWRWRGPAPDFAFLTGSCAFHNDPPFDRPGRPYGQGGDIFGHMARSGADFMVWLGDNLYLRESDYTSETGIWTRYQHDRAMSYLQPLYRAMAHYAIWDDHDYGPNDSTRSFEFKSTALKCFESYWLNPSAGEPSNPGIYTQFMWSDCAFFLLDNRFHRDSKHTRDPARTQFGEAQLDWLEQGLLYAQDRSGGNATFKFIASGGQFLRTNRFDCLAQFPRDEARLFNFLNDHGITGVVFLSGDRHFAEMVRQDRGGSYPYVDVTSSPLSAGTAMSALKEERMLPRVPGTLVEDQNYCRFDVSGASESRRLTITCFNKLNEPQWTNVIEAASLRGPVADP